MTEYDYSPGAYARHMQKMHSIARWADTTSKMPPSNPFVPDDNPPPHRSKSTSSRPTPNRSQTLPSSTYTLHTGNHEPKRHKSSKSSKSSSSKRHDRERSPPARSQTYGPHTAPQPRSAPIRSNTMPYQHSGAVSGGYMIYQPGGQTLYAPPGSTYVPGTGGQPGYVVPARTSPAQTPTGQSPSIMKKITGFFTVNSVPKSKGSSGRRRERRGSWS